MIFHRCRSAALTLLLGMIATEAIAQSGYQYIDGTRVYTEVFQSQGYARFSNECGSQELTQRQLQAGAKPTNIIPCPRPGTGASQIDPDTLRREIERIERKGKEAGRQYSLKKADDHLREAQMHERNKEYDAAKNHYFAAAVNYELAGESEKQQRAERSVKRVKCNGSLHEYDRLEAAGEYKGDLYDQLNDADEKCAEYPNAVAHIAKKRAELLQTSVPAVQSAPERDRAMSRSVPYNLNVAKQSDGTCRAGFVIARNMRDQCVVRGAAECYAGPISCDLETSSGCCFNRQKPPVYNMGGHFCCPRGTQCVYDEGPTLGTCQ